VVSSGAYTVSPVREIERLCNNTYDRANHKQLPGTAMDSTHYLIEIERLALLGDGVGHITTGGKEKGEKKKAKQPLLLTAFLGKRSSHKRCWTRKNTRDGFPKALYRDRSIVSNQRALTIFGPVRLLFGVAGVTGSFFRWSNRERPRETL
jgi:hypothetical protein